MVKEMDDLEYGPGFDGSRLLLFHGVSCVCKRFFCTLAHCRGKWDFLLEHQAQTKSSVYVDRHQAQTKSSVYFDKQDAML